MNKDLDFLFKILRNSLILGFMYFGSIWASTSSIDFILHIKPIIIFMIGYISAELIVKYKISVPNKRTYTKTLML